MSEVSKPGKSAAKLPAQFEMPTPPPIVVWRPAPNADSAYAIVTKVGRHAISVLVFPTESRGGVPKDGVRFIDDPQLGKIASSDGLWEYTEETKQLRELLAQVAK